MSASINLAKLPGGPWTEEAFTTDGLSYRVLLDANEKIICDTFNADLCEIYEELDEDGAVYRWDEAGRLNLGGIAMMRNALLVQMTFHVTPEWNLGGSQSWCIRTRRNEHLAGFADPVSAVLAWYEWFKEHANTKENTNVP